MPKITERLKKSWNAFFNKDPTDAKYYDHFRPGYMVNSTRPDRRRLTPTNGKTIISSIYNRIALDVASINFAHGKVDENGRYKDTIQSSLEEILTVSPNLDQTPNGFIQDLVLSMFDEGCIAVVPIDTDISPATGRSKILSLKVGKIIQWYPDRIRVEAYNERLGKKQQLMCLKQSTAILENPFYSVMNSRNGTKERLTHKMLLLDKIDQNTASNKLDLIVQVPYLVKSPAQKQRAKSRIEEMETQLRDSPLGIAYSDGTEKIVQLSRTLTNTLPDEIKSLQQELFNQLGMSQSIFDGTADEGQLIYYHNTTIEPICDLICQEFTRKFLSSTAIAQGQRILYYKDPFKLTTLEEIAKATEKLIPAQVVTPNEIRAGIGLKPSDQPQADMLANPNINTIKDADQNTSNDSSFIPDDDNIMNTPLSKIDKGE